MSKYDKQEDEEAGSINCGICGTASPAGTVVCASCGGSMEEEEPELEELELPNVVKVEEEIQDPDSDPSADDEEEEEDEDDDQDEEETPETLEIKMTMPLIGLALSAVGILGIIMLRLGYAQTMLGYSNTSPGMGPEESMAQIVSMIPIMIGILIIGLWGVKNDPIYKKIEKMKEKKAGIAPDDEDAVPEEFTEPVPDSVEVEPIPKTIVEPDRELEELEVEEPLPEKVREMTPAPIKSPTAEELKRVERCEKMLGAVKVLPDDRQKLKSLIKTGISIENFTEEIKSAVSRRKKKEQEMASPLEAKRVTKLAGPKILDDKKRKELEEKVLKEIEELDSL
jgi:hypothetical protein